MPRGHPFGWWDQTLLYPSAGVQLGLHMPPEFRSRHCAPASGEAMLPRFGQEVTASMGSTFLRTITLLLAAMLGPTAHADDPVHLGDLMVLDYWARESIPGVPNSSAYMTLHNHSGAADRLLEAAAPVAERVELHTHLMDGGVMRMRQVEAIDLPAGGVVELKPHGLHVMIIGLHAPLAAGDHIPLTLTFEHAGSVTIDVPVRGLEGAAGSGHSH